MYIQQIPGKSFIRCYIVWLINVRGRICKHGMNSFFLNNMPAQNVHTTPVAPFPGNPIFSTYTRKDGGPGTQNPVFATPKLKNQKQNLVSCRCGERPLELLTAAVLQFYFTEAQPGISVVQGIFDPKATLLLY